MQIVTAKCSFLKKKRNEDNIVRDSGRIEGCFNLRIPSDAIKNRKRINLSLHYLLDQQSFSVGLVINMKYDAKYKYFKIDSNW